MFFKFLPAFNLEKSQFVIQLRDLALLASDVAVVLCDIIVDIAGVVYGLTETVVAWSSTDNTTVELVIYRDLYCVGVDARYDTSYKCILLAYAPVLDAHESGVVRRISEVSTLAFEIYPITCNIQYTCTFAKISPDPDFIHR